MKKKILYVITKGNFGGAQRYVFDLATNIPKEEFDIVVAYGEGETLGKNLEQAGIRTIHIKSLKRNVSIISDIKSFFSLWGIIKKEKPNVIHLNSSKVGLMGVIITRLINIFYKLSPKKYHLKAIFTGHGWASNEERKLLSKIFIMKLHWFTILLSHRTIAVSKRTADQISIFPFIKKKIKIIYNGIDNFPTLSQDAARGRIAPELSARIWIGTISELHRSKGLDHLIKSFAPLVSKYANACLVIVGSGEEEANLKKLVSDLEIEERVVFAGFIPDARTYLKAFDIATLTSRTEAFPYAILEAGVASLPVIASWVGGIPEIITNLESGLLIDPKNKEKLTDTLDELIARNELRTSLGQNLNEIVTNKFTIEKMIKPTIALY